VAEPTPFKFGYHVTNEKTGAVDKNAPVLYPGERHIGVIVDSSRKRTLSYFHHYISNLRKYQIGLLFGFGATKSAFFVAKPGCEIGLNGARPTRQVLACSFGKILS